MYMNLSALKSLISECITEIVNENVSQQAIEFKQKLYGDLAKMKFRMLGEEPRNYMEFYVYNTVSLMISVNLMDETVRIEIVYDSEMLSHKNQVVEKHIKYDTSFYYQFVSSIKKIQSALEHSEALYGGIDEI